jgi:hypothetical protein
MISTDVQYIVGEKGDRTAVIMPIEEYEELMEDIHDLGVIAERREDPSISLTLQPLQIGQIGDYRIVYDVDVKNRVERIQLRSSGFMRSTKETIETKQTK